MALMFDPEAVPVTGVDDHLPAVDPQRLSPAALKERFAHPPAWTPEIVADRRFVDREPTSAAVLILLVVREELTVLLTRRTDHLRDHAGQISFPGGRVEPQDADPVATALRETEEEIGLAHGQAEVIGTLPTYTTGTGFVVTPVVALIRPGFTLAPDPFEVAEVFEVPLAFLMNPAMHRRHEIPFGEVRREYFSMPWQAEGRRYFIWGATAAMLRNLYRFLSA